MIKDEYFEGDYRRRPSQNFSGVRRNQKIIDFIDKVKHERKKRETSKAELKKAILLQAVFRGQLCRKQIKFQLSNELSNKISELRQNDSKNMDFDLNDIRYLISRLQIIYQRNFFRRAKIIQEIPDSDNIKYIAHTLFKYQKTIILAVLKETDWLWRITYFLSLYMDFIKCHLDDVDETMPFLDNMKSFLDTGIKLESELSDDKSQVITTIIESLLSNGLFKYLIIVLENRSTESSHPLHNFTLIIYDLLKIICKLMSNTQNPHFVNISLKLFAEEILCKELSTETKRLVFFSFKELETFPIQALCEIIYYADDENLYSVHTLHNFLIYFERDNILRSIEEQRAYFQLLSKLTMSIPLLGSWIDPLDDGIDGFDCDTNEMQHNILNDCLDLINTTGRTKKWNTVLNAIVKRKDYDGLFWFSKCLYHIWLYDSSPIYKYRLIRKVAFQPTFLKELWNYINQQKRILSFSSRLLSVDVLSMLSAGVFITAEEADRIIPTITMFCFLLKNYIALSSDETLHNEDLFPEAGNPIAFSLNEIVSICSTFKEMTIGIISLAFPTISFDGIEKRIYLSTPSQNMKLNSFEWKTLLDQIISLLKSLYDRDCRQQFTKDSSFWLSGTMEGSNQIFSQLRGFENISLFPSNLFSSVPQNVIKPFTINECRYLTIIRTLPFTVNFLKRFSLYQKYIAEDKLEFQDPHMHFFHTSNIFVGIRRDYLYEDTFERLLLEPEIKRLIRVNMINAQGIEEQGIDGGGLFREFILEFLKTAFDPNRGFFILTRDNEFYPNPNILIICKDFKTHYKFIGKMLGKALFENIIVEVTLADFFLTEILGFYDEFYINGLANLDPDLYKNLISLTCYDGDISELGLDFTLTLNDFGKNKVVELKPNGKDIPVNEENVLEYVYLVAKYKVHLQIEEQTSSFSEGLNSVISLEWLHIFTSKELQIIISGNKCPIDVDDMRANTVYTGGLSENHPTIVMFWNVVKSFDNKHRSLLLRFVTSCSRPPLLGFKELYPPFCIQLTDSDDNRLPTSSTCMNMLKLPMFTSEEKMKKRLIYAIQSRSGFDLA